jgi:hypothetical protein
MVYGTNLNPEQPQQFRDGKKFVVGFLLIIICFFLPIQMYSIGGSLGSGIQTAFFRFQETIYGTGFIFLNQDIGYIISGTYEGISALSVIVWLVGSIILVSGTFCQLLIPGDRFDYFRKKAGILIISGGFCYLLSCIIRYGFLLHSDAGFSIPLGIPLIFFMGWFVWHDS